MGFKDFIKKQFLDIIEWEDDSNDTLLYKFPMQDNEIQNGGKLIVRPGQAAVFLNEGQIADVFTEGTHTLITKNLPILGDLKGWAFGFKSPFKADVYFVNTKKFLDLKWGTPQPLWVSDPKFEQVELRAFGTFAFRLVDPRAFVGTVTGAKKTTYKVGEIQGQLKSFIIKEFATILSNQGVTVAELARNYNIISDAMIKEVEDEFGDLGLEMTSFAVESISLPEDLNKILKERSSINMLGGMENYKQKRMLDAMEKAADNPNGGGMAQAGMGAGMGFGFGQMMAQGMMPQQPQQPTQEPTKPTARGGDCTSCGHQVDKGAKFCGECGAKVEPLKPKKKFCSECGNVLKPNDKFCGECGHKF